MSLQAFFKAHLQNCEKWPWASSCLFVPLEHLGSHWTDFYDVWYLNIFEKSLRESSSFIIIWQKYQVLYVKTYVHLWYLGEFLLEWEIFWTKVVEKIKTHSLCSVFFFSKNCAINEIMWNNVVESDRPYMPIQPMCIACWIRKGMDTRLECEILTAFPWQHWLHVSTSICILPVLLLVRALSHWWRQAEHLHLEVSCY